MTIPIQSSSARTLGYLPPESAQHSTASIPAHTDISPAEKSSSRRTHSADTPSTSSTFKSVIRNRLTSKSPRQKITEAFKPYIESLKPQQSSVLKEDAEMLGTSTLYIKTECTRAPGGPNHQNKSLDLRTTVDQFVKAFFDPSKQSPKQSLLLLGPGGIGKSTFSRHLTLDLWDQFTQNDKKLLPIFISLPTLKDPHIQAIPEFLKSYHLSESDLQKLQQEEGVQLLFIFDGYDEMRIRQKDFYQNNQLQAWNAPCIFNARPEHLPSNSIKRIKPFHPEKEAVAELWLNGFSQKDIQHYLTDYFNFNKTATEICFDRLKKMKVMGLVKNPFMLKMALQALDELEKESAQTNLTRISFFEKCLESWYQRSEKRLEQIQLTERLEEDFDYLKQYDFLKQNLSYCQDLAIQMTQTGEVIARGSSYKNLKKSENSAIELLYLNAPLNHTEDESYFAHTDLQYYFAARACYISACNDSTKNSNGENIFNNVEIIKKPEIFQFLIELFKNSSLSKISSAQPDVKKVLMSWIERAKEDPQYSVAAAASLVLFIQDDSLAGSIDPAVTRGLRLLSEANFIFDYLPQKKQSSLEGLGIQFDYDPNKESKLRAQEHDAQVKEREEEIYKTIAQQQIELLKANKETYQALEKINAQDLRQKGESVKLLEKEKTLIAKELAQEKEERVIAENRAEEAENRAEEAENRAEEAEKKLKEAKAELAKKSCSVM